MCCRRFPPGSQSVYTVILLRRVNSSTGHVVLWVLAHWFEISRNSCTACADFAECNGSSVKQRLDVLSTSAATLWSLSKKMSMNMLSRAGLTPVLFCTPFVSFPCGRLTSSLAVYIKSNCRLRTFETSHGRISRFHSDRASSLSTDE